MDRERPRSKSPHMDNEEPIELAHYPGGRIPEPDEVPAIGEDLKNTRKYNVDSLVYFYNII